MPPARLVTLRLRSGPNIRRNMLVLPYGLPAASRCELRGLFDQLNLEVNYHAAERAQDVAITLYGDRADRSLRELVTRGRTMGRRSTSKERGCHD